MGGKQTVGVANLDLRANGYHAAVYIPERLRPAMGGKRVLRENPDTRNPQEAIRKSGPVLARFRSLLANAADQAANAVPAKLASWLTQQAEVHRRKADDLARQAA